MPKVIAVDDDPVMTEYYSALFAEAGCDVEIAVDCGSALDAQTRGVIRRVRELDRQIKLAFSPG